MSTPTHDTTIVADSVELLTDGFRGRLVIEGLLKALTRRVQELETLTWELTQAKLWANAAGVWLDNIGRIVGEPRLLRSDAEYRIAIQVRILVNRSKGRAEDMIKIARLIASANGNTLPAVYREGFPLDFEVEIIPLPGAQYAARLLGQARAATAYGTLVSGTLTDADYSRWGWSDDSSGAEFTWSLDPAKGSGGVAPHAWHLPPKIVDVGSYTAPAWDPSRAAAPLAMWLRADLGVSLVSGKVSDWTDQSTHSRNQGTVPASGGVYRPGFDASDADYNNQPVLTFDGSQYAVSGAWLYPVSGPRALLVVGDAASVTAFLAHEPDTSELWTAGSTHAEWYASTNPLAGTTANTSQPSLILITDDGTHTRLYVNDFTTPEATYAGSFDRFEELSVGLGVAGVGNQNGRTAEIAMWTGVFSAADRTALRAYLLDRYAL